MDLYVLIVSCMMMNGFGTSVKIYSVGSLHDTGSLRCGSQVTFICSIPTYKYTMKWLIDSDKVAECVTTNCVQYPPYKVDNIEFSPDTNSGEFNLTINQVTLKADGRKIKSCYGSESDQLELAVKVFPTQNTTKIVESKDHSQKMINITAVTGCVFPGSAITMQWYYYEEGQNPKLYKRSSPAKAIIFSVCSSGTCGGNDVVKLSSTLSLPVERNGKEYFFQIAIGHKDTGDVILMNSSRSYRINELAATIGQTTVLPIGGRELCTGVLLGIVCIVVIIVILVIVVTLIVIRKYRGQNERYQPPSEETEQVSENTSDEATHIGNKDDCCTNATTQPLVIHKENATLNELDETKEDGNKDDCCSIAMSQPFVINKENAKCA